MTSPKLAKTTRSGRTYTHPTSGNNHPSVTTVLGIVGKADALKHWAANEVAKYAVNNRDTWAALDTAAAIDLLKREPLRMLDRAASRGTDVHAIAEAYATTGTLPKWADEISGYVTALRKFFNDHRPQPVLVECTVFNEEIGYAGSFDLVCQLPALGDGLCILDYKTSKAIYPDVAAQLAAYAHAPEYVPRDGNQPERMPDIAHGVVVRLAADGTYEMVQCDIVAGFQYFKTVRAVYAIDTKPFLLGNVDAPNDDRPQQIIYIRNRIEQIKQNPAALASLLATWPVDLPTMKNNPEPDRMWIATVDRMLIEIEREHNLPFAAGNPAATPAPVATPNAPTPVMPTVASVEVNAVKQRLANSSDKVREAAAQLAREASAARKSISLAQKPTFERYAIVSAMLDMLAESDGDLQFVSNLLEHFGYRTERTLGADLGALTAEQAIKMSTTIDQIKEGRVAVTYDHTANTFTVHTKG